MIKFLSVLLFSVSALAADPPVSLTGQFGTKNLPAWNLEVPFAQSTKTGGINALIETGSNNVLGNPGFEHSTATTNWTAAGSPTVDTTTQILGKKALILPTIGSAGDMLSQTFTNCSQFLGNNMEATIYAKTAQTVVQMCSVVAGVEYQCQPVNSGNTWNKYTLNFPAPSTGSCGVKLKATAVTSGTVTVDGAYLGLSRNVANIAQSNMYGRIVWPTTTNCAWTSGAQVPTFGNFGVDTDCGTPTVFGQATAPGTKIPAITFATLPAGDYQISVMANMNNGILYNYYRLSDGATLSTNSTTIYGSATGTAAVGNGSHVFNLRVPTTMSNVTLQMQGMSSTGGGSQIFAGSESATLDIAVYRFPTSTEQAISPLVTPFKVDVNISGADTSLGTAAVTTYDSGVLENAALTMTNNTSIGSDSSAQIGCSSTNGPTGLTCGVGNESVSLSFIPPKACNAMRVCFDFAHYAASAATTLVSVNSVFSVSKTAINSQTALLQGQDKLLSLFKAPAPASGTVESSRPFSACGTFPTDTARQMFRLRYTQAAATAATNVIIGNGASGSSGFQDIHASAQCLDDTMPAPLLVGGVVYNDTVQAGGVNGVTSIASGTYTPTLTGVANVTGTTAVPCAYTRIGKIVQVSCYQGINCTTASTTTQVGMSLPIATNPVDFWDISGGLTGDASNPNSGLVYADITNKRAQLQFTCNGSGLTNRGVNFSYVVK